MITQCTLVPNEVIWGAKSWVGGLLIALLMGVAELCIAQDIDSIHFKGRGHSTSLLGQISNPSERKHFQRLLDEADAKERLELAETFPRQFPRSHLLAHAYDVAAKASIELEELARARLYGDRSLAFLPENPLLLVPLANVEVQLGRLNEADHKAREALLYLDLFDKPARYSVSEWALLLPELRAAAFYVLGRTAAARALKANGVERKRLLESASEHLSKARDLNPADPLSAHLLGLIELLSGRPEEAAMHFADASRAPSPVQKQAEENLRQLGYEDVPPVRKELTKQPASSAEKRQRARYAGSESCRRCHAEVFSSWQRTGMARMFRPYRPENIIGDFSGSFEGKVRMSIKDDRHQFELRDTSGKWRRYRVDYTIGSKWQQAYASRLPNGEMHVLPIQYSRVRGKWINFWRIIDGPDSERANLRSFHELTEATSYQLHCAPCHTSQTQAEAGRVAAEEVNFREAGINCEMCHGPLAAHAEKGERAIGFGDIGHEFSVRICAQCHMQSRVLEPGPRGELNYSGDQDDFTNGLLARPYSEFSSKAFYPDGRFRETTFIVESFLRSACYREGKAHCASCHDPHPDNPELNPTSLKFLDEPDRMCTQCHAGYAAAHTHHPAASGASRCTSCHMPKIMNSMLFTAGTHRIDSVPNPAMTLRFSQRESPNACLICHQDKDAPWVARQLEQW